MKVKLKETKKENYLDKKIYKVISIEYNCFRIYNKLGEPTLYDIESFDIVDNKIDNEWVILYDKDEIEYLGYKEFSSKYFFEDFFDNKKEELKSFLEFVIRNRYRNYCKLKREECYIN